MTTTLPRGGSWKAAWRRPDGAPPLRRLFRARFAILALCAWALFGLLSVFTATHPYGPADLALARWVQAAGGAALPATVPLVTWLAGTPGGTVSGVAVLAAVGLVSRRALPFAVVVELGAWATYGVVNAWLRRPRPTPDLIRVLEHPPGYGWPSGHATYACTQVALLLLCVAGLLLPRRALYPATVLGALVVLLFCVERVYVGVHWPSQTLGGVLVAACWIALALSVRRLSEPVLARLGRPGPVGARGRAAPVRGTPPVVLPQ
jgi:undecaprenyl-diphosphatase